jgi:2-polyprenyl-3-methyl-5-hydroxy-6-metoxy-1,4-benzoquinol methylase
MCEGYDGNNIYQLLSKYLPVNSTLLELGSGGGLDIEYLKKTYSITGSDLSEEFLKVCKKNHPEVTFLKLNAMKLELDDQFDCVYSNKVLHHLTKDELKESILKQAKILSPEGLIAHSFWLGEDSQEMNGMLFTYYKRDELLNIMSESFDILSTLSYQEFEENDSLFVIARIREGIV